MKIETKYDIGQTVFWVINGLPMVVCQIKVYSEDSVEYICSFADENNMPKELTFAEKEIEPTTKNGFGFNKK